LLKYFSKKDQHVQQNTRTGSQQSHLPENSHHVEDNDNVEPGNEDEVGLNTVTRDSDVYSPPTDTFNQIFEQEVEQRGSSAHKHKEGIEYQPKHLLAPIAPKHFNNIQTLKRLLILMLLRPVRRQVIEMYMTISQFQI